MSRAGLVNFDTSSKGKDKPPFELVNIKDGTEAPILKYAIDHGIEIDGKSSDTKSALELTLKMLQSDNAKGKQDAILLVTDGQSSANDSPCDKDGFIEEELLDLGILQTRIVVLAIGDFNRDNIKCLYEFNPNGEIVEVESVKDLGRDLFDEIFELL